MVTLGPSRVNSAETFFWSWARRGPAPPGWAKSSTAIPTCCTATSPIRSTAAGCCPAVPAADSTVRAAARGYLLRLAALAPQDRRPAAAVPKSYRPPALQALHVAMICLFRLLALVPGAGELAASSPLPDFASRRPERLVIKSVHSSEGLKNKPKI